jgi:8-oxo-dGTP diphosphatase
MGKAARAIVIEGTKLLVMHRNKHGSEYFTLVGGRVAEGETLEQALMREMHEETGLTITGARLVFIEEHAAPYNEQYIYLCSVAPHTNVAIQEASEEGFMNRVSINTHTPLWVEARAFDRLQFRTPQLQRAIFMALQRGFPAEPIKI